MKQLVNPSLIQNIRELIDQSRHSIKQTINTVMVTTYWNIGRLIIEDEQQGEFRATYGKR
jgi:hypothetical protein